MNYATLGQLTKQKYPQYEGLSDEELGRRVAQKYPQYQAKITSDKEPITQPGQTLLQSAVESLLPAPSAIAKDVKASEKVPTYVNSQNDQTQKLLDLTDKIKYARSIGDKNMENEAIAE